MAKLHIKNRYWVTPDSVLNHRWLSWKAKGIYGYIQSKPENWDFAISRFEGKDWKDSTQSWVWELEKFWYLNREKKRQPDGTWDIEYTLYESPEDNPNQGGKSATVDALTKEENPPTDNPATENPPTITDRDIQTEVVKQISILEIWNSKKIIEHKNSKWIQDIISITRKKFTDDEILKAIDNYSIILHSEKTYWDHKWTLQEFLTRKNGLPVFLYKTEDDYLRTDAWKEKVARNAFVQPTTYSSPNRFKELVWS